MYAAFNDLPQKTEWSGKHYFNKFQLNLELGSKGIVGLSENTFILQYSTEPCHSPQHMSYNKNSCKSPAPTAESTSQHPYNSKRRYFIRRRQKADMMDSF